ncbi:MAG: hypothetical protein U0996_04330 [Planctomycetaceae bacterium]
MLDAERGASGHWLTRLKLWFAVLFCLAIVPSVVQAQKLERWVYAPVNLLVPQEVERLELLMKEAAGLGYTHVLITDSKFCRLPDMDQKYFGHVTRIREHAKGLQLQLVPAVFPVGYSNSLLSQDVNLAEGLPVRQALFEVRNGVATLVPDPEVALPAFSDRKAWNFIDETLKADGEALTVTNPKGENCRAVKTVNVSPFRHYHVSVKVRTKDFRGQPQIAVLEPKTGRRLSHTNLTVERSQDWTVQHITFNSLDNPSVSVYIGAWGPTGGQMSLAEAKIEECGLLNVLRRPGAPLVITTDGATPRTLEEGVDFEPVRDPKLGSVPYAGEYEVFHESPAVMMKGSWADGTRLRISWYHPHVVYDGQVCACVTEPGLQELLKRQANDIEKIFPSTDRMMSHDEWRVLGWDETFRQLGRTPGQVVADNVRFCTKQLKTLDSNRRIFVWSDMFDPHHNAVDNYYLVNGDLTGSWEGLSRDTIIMNWNFGVRAESLKFFADRGHKQILAGYYDADANQIRRWLETAHKQKVDGVIGVMYTTWKQDYSQLREFRDVIDRFEQAPGDGNDQ